MVKTTAPNVRGFVEIEGKLNKKYSIFPSVEFWQGQTDKAGVEVLSVVTCLLPIVRKGRQFEKPCLKVRDRCFV